MMSLKRLVLTLPCTTLEDFPTYHKGDDAHNVLTAWIAAWHPALIHASQKLPSWTPHDQPPADFLDCLFLAPECSQTHLGKGFRDRSDAAGAAFLDVSGDRSKTTVQIFQALEYQDDPTTFPKEVVDEFHALSYTYLQIELLSRQLRYCSSLDLEFLEQQVVAAANAAAEGNATAMNIGLDRCYDALSEERHRYYPMDSRLTDLTLLAPTTLGASLKKQLEAEPSFSLLSDAWQLSQLKIKHPDNFQLLVEKEKAGTVELVGGLLVEPPTNLLSYQMVNRNVSQGRTWFAKHFSRPLEIFAQRSAGLESTLPGILSANHFSGALHQSFEGAKIPTPGETSFRWEGPDGSIIQSITRTALDAALPETFLRLGVKIGETLDQDHLAVCQLVHWPGETSPFYWDLYRSCRRSDTFGKWCSHHDVIKNLDDPGYSQHDPDESYSNRSFGKLCPPNSNGSDSKGSEAADSLGTLVENAKSWRQWRQLSILQGMTFLAGSKSPVCTAPGQETGLTWLDEKNLFDVPEGAPDRIAAQIRSLRRAPEDWMSEQLNRTSTQLAAWLSQSTSNDGLLIFNPDTIPRRFVLSPDQLPTKVNLRPPAAHLYAQQSTSDGEFMVVDVPSAGYVHLSRAPSKTKAKPTKSSKNSIVTEANRLQNEFVEASIDPQSGSLRSLLISGQRGNLCSLQIACFDDQLKQAASKSLSELNKSNQQSILEMIDRKTPIDEKRKELRRHKTGYTRMKAIKISTTNNNSIIGQIDVTGQLLVMDTAVADYQISYRLTRGSRILDIETTISPATSTQAIAIDGDRSYRFDDPDCSATSPYQHYFCWRFAYSDTSAKLTADLNTFQRPVYASSTFVAPTLYQIQSTPKPISVFTHGTTFHRRLEDGMVDSILGNQMTAEITSRLSIGIDVNGASGIAEGSADPVIVPATMLRKDFPPSAWLFSCSNPNVLVSGWENRFDGDQWIGISLQLLETSGQNRKARLDFSMPTRSVNAKGCDPQFPPQVDTDANGIQIGLGRFEALTLTIDF